jgi:hypothetical protein
MSVAGPGDSSAALAARVRGLIAARDLDALADELVDINYSPPGFAGPEAGYALGLALAMRLDNVVELMRLLARQCAGMGVWPDMVKSAGLMFQQLAEGLPDESLPLVCDYWLGAAKRVDYRYCIDGLIRMARARLAAGAPLAPELITRIRRHDAQVAATLDGPVLNGGEAWSDAALADAAQRGPAWRDLLAHAVTSSGAMPSARWEPEARAKLAAVGEPAAAGQIRAWLALVGKPRTGSGLGLDDTIDPHDADAVRGLAWMLGLIAADADSARSLAGLAETVLRKIPGIGPRSPKIANAAVYALSRMPGEDALAQLGRLATRITYRGTLTQLDKALHTRAAELGVTREQIEEMAVPDFGLTEVSRRTERFGEAAAELVIHGRAADLIRRSAAGKVVKSPPAEVRRDFAEEVKELKSAAADVEKMLPAQAERLERLFLAQRSWEFRRWSEYYLDHRLVGTLARRLIWTIGDVPAAHADGALRALGGAALAPASDTPVELWHPIGRETAEILAWRDWLEWHQVTQPFKQAHREVYLLTAAEQATRTYSNRFAAHILCQHQFNALATQRGWRNRLRLMVDDDCPPATRDLPQWGLRAEFWIEGLGTDYETDTTGSGAFLHVATDQVRFYPARSAGNVAHAYGGGYRRDGGNAPDDAPVPLTDVPPLVLSELLRDVDLFVGVASVGNDPGWQDGGPGGRYGEYWRSYSFGELSETACTRADLLRRLLPRLAIGPQCTVEGRFLHVRGTLHTYKIHLGSANILMSPGDTYLCIVPASSAPDPGVVLPFEGDQTLAIILSKAMLLANDTKITDPAITSQIRRTSER